LAWQILRDRGRPQKVFGLESAAGTFKFGQSGSFALPN
jgi:hypothetical protein